MMKPHWEHFSHDADIGVRGFGRTQAEAFEQAGLALTAVITDPALVRALESVTFDMPPAEPDLLFVDWLNRLVFEMAVGRRLFSRFDVSIDEFGLHASIHGEATDRNRHSPAVEVKGATFTELRVAQVSGGFMAQCVVDV